MFSSTCKFHPAKLNFPPTNSLFHANISLTKNPLVFSSGIFNPIKVTGKICDTLSF
ncbi:hypothetical protein MADA3029_650200 [Vibrio nigripulchritudo MADA3029]|nr:hypothetical protein MADA3029_650200 [Vibrio nigripulchritudo MADA3029]